MAKSVWFKRLEKDLHRISPQLRMVKLPYGFYRIYFKGAYVHEVYEEMPAVGYTYEDYDVRAGSLKYMQEYEDTMELTRKVKNYVEGYYDSILRIQKRLYQFKHNLDHYKSAKNAYAKAVIK